MILTQRIYRICLRFTTSRLRFRIRAK